MTKEQIAKMKAGRERIKHTDATMPSSDGSFVRMSDKQKEEVKRVSEYTPSVKGMFLKCFDGKHKAMAIKCRCIQCAAYQKVEVTECTVEDCALWMYRPYQKRSRRAKA